MNLELFIGQFYKSKRANRYGQVLTGGTERGRGKVNRQFEITTRRGNVGAYPPCRECIPLMLCRIPFNDALNYECFDSHVSLGCLRDKLLVD